MRRARDAAFLLLVLAAYVAASLWPFGPWRWEAPRQLANAAVRTAEGGVAFPAPGAVTTGSAPAWLADAIAAQRLGLRLVAHSAAIEQHGPARLISIAPDEYARNLTLGQEGVDLDLRVRLGSSTAPRLDDGASVFRLPGLFATSGPIALELELVPGRLRLLVDGIPRLEARVGERPLEAWSDRYPLTLGNEATFDRPWLGSIAQASATVDGTEHDLLGHDAVEGAPTRLRVADPRLDLVPFRHLNLSDEALNLLGYIPLGLIVGLMLRRRGAGWPALALAGLGIAMLSALMELLQVGLPLRTPSVTDWILNGAGGAIGLVLGGAWPLPGLARRAAAAKM
jgi:hypothetical protein